MGPKDLSATPLGTLESRQLSFWTHKEEVVRGVLAFAGQVKVSRENQHYKWPLESSGSDFDFHFDLEIFLGSSL